MLVKDGEVTQQELHLLRLIIRGIPYETAHAQTYKGLYNRDRRIQAVMEILRRPRVAERLELMRKEASSGLTISDQRVLAEIAAVGFADIKDLFRPDGSLCTVQEMPERTTRAIKRVRIRRVSVEAGSKLSDEVIEAISDTVKAREQRYLEEDPDYIPTTHEEVKSEIERFLQALVDKKLGLTEEVIDIEFHDKLKALSKIAQIKGMTEGSGVKGLTVKVKAGGKETTVKVGRDSDDE